MATTHVAVAGSKRVPLPGSRLIGRTHPHAEIEVTLKLRRKQALPELNRRPAKLLSRDQLAQTYGASEDDVNKVKSVFEGLGLKTVHADAGTRTVRLAGTVEAMQNAFNVKLFDYAHADGNYRGRVGNVQVPQEVSGIVEAVIGLDNRRVAHRKRPPQAQKGAQARSVNKVPSTWFTPAELAKHYNYPAGDGTGQTVALLEFGGGYFPADLSKFCSLTNITPVPNVKTVSTDGTATDAHDGAEGEVMLDVEVVAGVCPKANIVVYFADFTEQGWVTILDAVMQDSTNNPGVVSCSWGYAEDADIWTEQTMNQVNQSLLEAARLGVTVCVAAGDDGSSDAITDGNAHTDFPSSSPYALAIGGTTVRSKTTGQPDITWKEGDGLRNDNGGSTGGGVSAVFPRPSWQSNINIASVNGGAIAGRIIPDIAANADWNASPYLLVVDGKSQPNGGTSAATPLIASLIALVNANRGAGNRLGYVTPDLYQSSTGAAGAGTAGCVDVIDGNNDTAAAGGYNAGPGYDAVSGWGTPDGIKLMNALSGANAAKA
jgi:kumamolisin